MDFVAGCLPFIVAAYWIARLEYANTANKSSKWLVGNAWVGAVASIYGALTLVFPALGPVSWIVLGATYVGGVCASIDVLIRLRSGWYLLKSKFQASSDNQEINLEDESVTASVQAEQNHNV